MRPTLANLIITSNPFSDSTPPSLNTPGSSPLLRPISSPMTPITPLMLSDTHSGAHYEKEGFFSHEAGYFFHNNHEEFYSNSPYYYTTSQPQVTVNKNSSFPLSSAGTTAPTNTNSSNTFNISCPNPVPANHYDPSYYMNSNNQSLNHQIMMSSYTAPTHISHHNYYNQQFYDGNNVNTPYDTLENAYHHYNHDAKAQNQDDAQFHEMITGLSKMDILDSL
jgi:hypothetical protein